MEQMSSRGHVDVVLVSPDGGRQFVDGGHNTLSYGCADAVARLFAGEVGRRPAQIVFMLGDFSLSADDPRVQGDIGIGVTQEPVSVDPNPKFSPSSDKYVGNIVTFSAMTVDNAAEKTVYGFLLKDATGRTPAARKLDAPITKPANYALSATWAVTFS